MALVSDEVTRSAGVDLVFFQMKGGKCLVVSAFRKLKFILDGSFIAFTPSTCTSFGVQETTS